MIQPKTEKEAHRTKCPFKDRNCFASNCFAWYWITEADNESDAKGNCELVTPEPINIKR